MQSNSGSAEVVSACRRLLRFGRMLTNKRGRVGNGLQAFDRDGLAGNLTEPVGPLLDALERPLDLRQLLPIPRIFAELCLPLIEEESLIFEIADPLLVSNCLLDAS